MKSNNPVVSSIIKNYNTSQKAFLPKIVSIPLTQERDSSYKCIVKPGDTVKEGDVIAQTEIEKGWTSSLHSSVPGKVISTEPCFSPNGRQEFAVKIQFGGALSYLGKIHHYWDNIYRSHFFFVFLQLIQNLYNLHILNYHYHS